MDVLNTVYQAFLNVITSGYAAIWPIVATFFVMVSVTEIIRGQVHLRGNPFIWLIAITRIGVFLWLMQNWGTIVGEFLNLMISIGIMMGQGSITAAEFQNPSLLVEQGYRLAWHLISYQPSGGFWAQIAGLATTILFLILGLIVIAAYFVMAILVMFAYLSIHIAALIGILLIPFGIHKWTVWLAEGVFGSIVSHGVRVMAMAFIANLAFPIVVTYTVTVNPTLQTALDLLILTITVLIMFVLVPGVAAGLLTGSSTLGTGAIFGTALGIGAAPFLMGAGVKGLATLTTQAGAVAGRSALYAAGSFSALRTAGQMGYNTSLASSWVGKSVAGARGVGQAMGYAIATPARNAMSGMAGAYHYAQVAGGRAGYMGSGGSLPAGQRLPFTTPLPVRQHSGGKVQNAIVLGHRIAHLNNGDNSTVRFRI